MTFEEADKIVHPVETQWHYPIFTKYGFVPLTKEGIGFVRNYKYEHPTLKHFVSTTTGYNSDYWRHMKDKDSLQEISAGFWAALEPYLEKLINIK